MSQKEFIKSGKDSIRYNSIKELNQMLEEINKPNEYEINRTFLYKDLFLYACKHGTRDILIWFIELYYEFSVVEQIALRQIFFYGKYIATKNRRVNTNWFSNHVISLVKNV